ncbi:YgjV family protein [Paraferrimonas haliotis]|uniref:YgjV family protein n=1 Tax=Paraferrimonas haliotis TaxID=2013866 RepID=UPI00117C0459|nr:YgjV family protein [Paraferrimonas haliotis]
MATIDWLAQALGFISMGIGWYAVSRRDDLGFISFNLASALIASLHFALLDSMVLATIMLLSGLRFAISLKSRRKPWVWLFVGGALLQGLALAQYWYEWFAIVASMISSWAVFVTRGKRLRESLLLCNGLNLINAVGVMSWSTILYCSGTLVTLAYRLLKSEFNSSQLQHQ